MPELSIIGRFDLREVGRKGFVTQSFPAHLPEVCLVAAYTRGLLQGWVVKGPAAGRQRLRLIATLQLCHSCLLYWQHKAKLRPLAWATFRPHLAIVGFDQLLDNCQT